MHSPYTQDPVEAVMAAQSAVGLTLTALLWNKPLRPLLATLFLLAGAWLPVFVPIYATLFTGVGLHVPPDYVRTVFHATVFLAVAAAGFSGRPSLIATSVAVGAALWWTTDYLVDMELELAAAHLAYVGLLVGVHYRAEERPVRPQVSSEPRLRFLADDLGLFALATVLAAIVATVVLGRYTDSGDEWAPTYQAALFAHLKPYGNVPACGEAFRTFWVFHWEGRVFEQYPPGWAYFMVPFVAVGAPWLAGPFSLGVAVAGVARLTRRAAAGFAVNPPSTHEVRAAGLLGGLAMTLGSTVLINGASRFTHVFVVALFAWCAEALFLIADRALPRREQWFWGAVFGLCLALLPATRPADGATLGIGLGLYFAYALVLARFGWRSIASAAAAFSFVAGLSLLIMRLQVGKWFVPGYALNAVLNPWVTVSFSLPRPNEFKWGFPIATGSYCWWPLSPALGFAGLAALRGRANRIAFVSFFSIVPYLAFYTMLEMGRGSELGYGPRYVFPCVAPMAIGTGVMLAKLLGSGPLRARGPATLAFAAAIVGVIRIAPLAYPFTYADVHVHNRLHDAIARANIHNAIVFGLGGLNNTDPLDLPEDLPLDLYPNQDVLIALERTPELVRCVKEHFPQRKFYRAVPAGGEVNILPYPQ
jgi:hypothetical protein